LRNKALAELQKLFDKNSTKLFYIAKAVDTASVQYKKYTPNDVIYDNMDRHIINKADGYIYHAQSGSMLGRNTSDVIEFLKNPLNEDILKDLNTKIEKLWNS